MYCVWNFFFSACTILLVANPEWTENIKTYYEFQRLAQAATVMWTDGFIFCECDWNQIKMFSYTQLNIHLFSYLMIWWKMLR
jgi:hypothetical protein